MSTIKPSDEAVVNSTMGSPPPYYAHPPQAGYYPTPSAGPYGPPPPGTSVIMTPGFLISQHFGSKPIHYTCRSCNEEMITTVKLQATWRTHFFAGIFCLACCWPCVAIPYCVSDFQGAEHFCSKCNKFVGSYNI